MAAVAVFVGFGLTCAGASAGTWPVPAADHSSWFNFAQDLKDPTGTYTQKVWCNSFTPPGQATLYPYNVPEGSTFTYQWAYRNDSTSGVTVTSNSTATDDMKDGGLAFFVTSLHISGDYAFKISIQCQSNDPDAQGTVGTPSASNPQATNATIKVTFNSPTFATEPFKYYVQFGTKPAVYSSQTLAVSVNLPSGNTTESIPISGLTVGRIYHYRVVLVSQGEDFFGETSYSGADQQFGTGAALGGPISQPRLETIAPGRATGLRLTAPTRPGDRVSLRRPAGSALQYWTAASVLAGSQTTLVNARTGLCLDVRGGSRKTGAAGSPTAAVPAPRASSGSRCGRARVAGGMSTCEAARRYPRSSPSVGYCRVLSVPTPPGRRRRSARGAEACHKGGATSGSDDRATASCGLRR